MLLGNATEHGLSRSKSFGSYDLFFYGKRRCARQLLSNRNLQSSVSQQAIGKSAFEASWSGATICMGQAIGGLESCVVLLRNVLSALARCRHENSCWP